jgi:hypothetical protein
MPTQTVCDAIIEVLVQNTELQFAERLIKNAWLREDIESGVRLALAEESLGLGKETNG